MAYQVLAREYRPQTFEEVVGQKHVTQTLINAIREKRIGHAFLFAGERGVGKTSVARIFAKALNCHSSAEPTEKPCGTCPSCQEIKESTAIDVHEIDGASNTSVDDVRVLRENVRYLPSRDRRKVYIIDEVHMLSKPAFNALLKTLEEPPPHVIFIFATTEPEKIPDTILSRCLRLDFRRIPSQDIIAHLESVAKRQNIHISKRSLFLIARAAQGSMRDAQSLLDRIRAYCPGDVRDEDVAALLGHADKSLIYRVTESLLAEDPQGCIDAINTLYESGVDLKQFYYGYLEHLRDLMICKVSSGFSSWMNLAEEDLKEVEKLSACASAQELNRFFRLWFSAEDEINRSALPKIALEMCLLGMVHLRASLPVTEILEKLDALQKGMACELENEKGPPVPARTKEAVSVKKTPEQGGRHARAETPRDKKSGETISSEAVKGGKDASGFLDFIRQHSLPLASQLEHGNITLSGDNIVLIEFPAASIFLENIKESETEKKIKNLCDEYFKRAMELTIVASGKKAAHHENNRDRERKTLRQEVLHNPIIQKVIDLLDGEIVEVKTY